MNFTSIFVKRPVLASVVSLIILVLGLRSIASLEIREYPETKDTVISITTSYPGASSELIKGFITTPLQQAIAQAEGIDYLFSSSTQGLSSIEAHMRLNYDANAAIAEIQAKVASQSSVLPQEALDPIITSKTGSTTSLIYIAFVSDTMKDIQIADYLLRVVQPRLQSIEGVGQASLLGNSTYAMRIWLKPKRMAALGVSAEDVSAALRRNNYLSSVGKTKGTLVSVEMGATTDVAKEEDFLTLVVGKQNDTLIRLSDIADVELGAEGYESENLYSGKPAVFMTVDQSPDANPLDVAKRVNLAMVDINNNLPEGLVSHMPYDASKFISDSINEVGRTLLEAISIVIVVIFLSLGTMRAAFIPAVTVPLSLIGATFIMLAFGFSLNLLTLLAMILAIGLVVDDAIVMVENIHRHIDMGKPRIQAAIDAAKELSLPIIAMTTTLIAVYFPIGFMGGLVGTLFTEFAFSLAAAVLISGIVALTLAPMLSARILKSSESAGRFEKYAEHFFEKLASGYKKTVSPLLSTPSIPVIFGLVVLLSLYPMYLLSKSELAPIEDRNLLIAMGTAPQTSTLDFLQQQGKKLSDIFEAMPEYDHSFILLGLGNDTTKLLGGLKMGHQSTRERTQMEIQPELQQKVASLTGVRTAVVQPPGLPGAGGGLPVQFVVISDADYSQISDVTGELIGKAMQSGNFIFLQKSIEFDRPKYNLMVDKDRAADLGISMEEIGRNLSVYFSEGYVNRFSMQERSYKVIPQVADISRSDIEKLDNIYLKTSSGKKVPISSIVTVSTQVEPAKRTQFQQLNSITIEGLLRPGVTMGDGLAYLEEEAQKSFPRGFKWDHTGSSRQYKQQGSALVLTFFMSLLIIYLVLAAQFESWRDPLIILVSVPLSLASAMAFIMLGVATMNIYTQVGLITLIGLVAKNGILIVEFANQLQITEKLSIRNAVEEAATVRLRPILMTTASMIVAMVPLLLASGPGAVSRFDIGLVIATGLGIGTIFTLYILPAFYLIFARDHSKGND
ncbi:MULTISPECIES: efflux RND transporter permease subunit [Cycloclasticus]|uniref:RND family multidrug efflux transporter n=1 Tax=Cycloclasticus pugetii TaxID=34068 RepID=A0AB33Z172_9GAMM|nr:MULTISPECIES: efflux RND transporter permease subunit [Cycloclasticus]AFT67966.1 RND family multidrug efflux transporter [Cycloclasticus sp. P1]EPD12961.1 RND family multidrug efflux transporter [Cycloclasticus pugetii]SHI65952.1 multidrug efflux pump [Cycloclasticus pugetii]